MCCEWVDFMIQLMIKKLEHTQSIHFKYSGGSSTNNPTAADWVLSAIAIAQKQINIKYDCGA